MSSSPVYKQIRRSNRNMLLLSIVGLIIFVAVFVVIFLPYITAQMGGPKTLTIEEIKNAAATISDLQPMYNVKVSSTLAFDAGYEEYTTTNGVRTSTDAYFGVLFLDDEGNTILMFRSPSVIDENVTEYVGNLVKPSGVSREALDELVKDVPEVKDALIPLMLDTELNQFPWIIGGVVMAVLLLAVLYGFISFFTRSANPNNHPIMKRLKLLGEPETVLSEIENERMMGEQKVGNLVFTRSFLVFAPGNDFHAMRRSDIAWAYKQVTQNRYGKTYYAYVYDRNGRLISAAAKEDVVNQMLTAVLNYAPWAIAGYSNDIKKSWDRDRAGFIAAVDDRKRQAQQAHQPQ